MANTFTNIPDDTGGGGGAVDSVNGQTGIVILTAADVGAFELPSLTAGSVLFSDGTTIAEDNANFFWNDTNNDLRVGPDLSLGSKQSIATTADIEDPTADINGGVVSAGRYHFTTDSTKSTFGFYSLLEPSLDTSVNVYGGVIGISSLISRLDADDLGNVQIGAGYFSQLLFGNSAKTMGEYAGYVAGFHSIDNTGTITNLYDYLSLPSSIGGSAVTNRWGLSIQPDSGYTKKNWISGTAQIGGTSYANLPNTLYVAGDIYNTIENTDIATVALESHSTVHVTTDGDINSYGAQFASTATIDSGATNSKPLSGTVNTVTRGDLTDDGVQEEMFGTISLLINKSGVSGVTDEAIGYELITLTLSGTITDLYDFRSRRVTTTGTVTNHYGIYIDNDVDTPVQNYLSGNTLLGGTFSLPTHTLDINSDTIRIRDDRTITNSTDTGIQGEICWDTDYIYVCISTDTWKRTALTTW